MGEDGGVGVRWHAVRCNGRWAGDGEGWPHLRSLVETDTAQGRAQMPPQVSGNRVVCTRVGCMQIKTYPARMAGPHAG